MDKKFVYPSQIPLVEDQLQPQRFTQIGIGRLAGALFGENGTAASGFSCSVGSDFSVTVAPGQIVQPGVVDTSAYSVLAASSSALPSQYILTDPATLTVPSAAGTYLIYGTPVTADTDNIVFPFYNAANPSQTFAGEGNSGNSLPSTRAQSVSIGIAASVPSGSIPLWQVTVPTGATAVTGSMIMPADGAPFYPSLVQTAPWTVAPFNGPLASAFGGYPLNALVADTSVAGLYWISTADANTTTPGTTGASWVRSDRYKATPSTLVQTSSTGNFTVPSGVYSIRFRLRAGGGGGGAGGGNSTSAVSAGGGGGGGGWLEIVIAVQPDNNVSWVVGAGGSAGVNNGTSGTTGGDTILYVSGTEVARVTGGSGGANATEGGVGSGGNGGTSKVTTAVGYSSQDGAGGGYGIYAGVSQGWGGIGASSFGKSFVQVTGQNTTGISGQSGGGGSGGTGTSNGGPGAAGEVIYDF